jgi:nucleoid-associated protein YgaU
MIGKDSRYATAIVYTDGPLEFVGMRPPLDTSPRPDDQFHTVIDGDRLDLIAFRYLGRADLWWVVADYNEIRWPFAPETGQVLRVPSVETVQFALP